MLEFVTFCTNVPIKIAVSTVLAIGFVFLHIFMSKQEHEKYSRIGDFLLTAVLILLFLFSISTLVCNVPFWDDYDAILHYLSRPFSDRMRSIFDFHNEHRIVFPRLVFETVYAICGKFDFRVCILIGDIILLVYVFALGKNINKGLPWRYFIPFIALLLSLANYENTLWALTSIQSHSVLLFALLAIVSFQKRENVLHFMLALLFAVCATFTSGSGLGIWPCLALMGVKRYAEEEGCFSWRRLIDVKSAAKAFFRLKSLAFTFIMVITIALYMIGFIEKSTEHASLATESELAMPLIYKVVNGLDFGISFLGAIVPYHAIALPIGLVVVMMVFFVFYNFRRIENSVAFFFLLYLLSIVASGMLLRANLSTCGGAAACALRYGIVTFSIIGCLIALITKIIQQSYQQKVFLWEGICRLILFGALLINFGVQMLGYELVSIRKGNLERGIEEWPDSIEGLQYPDKQRASMILKEAEKSGIFVKTGDVNVK